MSFLSDIKARADTNSDGKVTYEEIKSLYKSLPVKTMISVAFFVGIALGVVAAKILL